MAKERDKQIYNLFRRVEAIEKWLGEYIKEQNIGKENVSMAEGYFLNRRCRDIRPKWEDRHE